LTDAELPEKSVILVAYLSRHPGKSFTAADLMDVLNLSNDRDLRDVVRYARLKLREPVISTFSGQYRWPEGSDDDEADHCIKQKRAVARDAFAVADAIEDGMKRRFPAEPVQLNLLEGVA
jgi:hypothetical protein